MKNLPFFKKFIFCLVEKGYSKETIYNYERDLKTFSNFLKEKGVEFQKITPQAIENYKNYLISEDRKTTKGQGAIKELSNFSINRMLSAIKAYLRYINENEKYNSPISLETIRMTKHKKRVQLDIKLEDQIKLVESPIQLEKNKLIGLRNRAMLEIIFCTGMRISELINLEINQIDNSGKILVKQGKNGKRFVHLTPRAQRHLKGYLEIRGKSSSPYLFIPYRGKNIKNKNKKISANYLQEKIKKYRELSGLDVIISAESLRYPFRAYLLEQKMNPPDIQILSRHRTSNITSTY